MKELLPSPKHNAMLLKLQNIGATGRDLPSDEWNEPPDQTIATAESEFEEADVANAFKFLDLDQNNFLGEAQKRTND